VFHNRKQDLFTIIDKAKLLKQLYISRIMIRVLAMSSDSVCSDRGPQRFVNGRQSQSLQLLLLLLPQQARITHTASTFISLQ